MQEPAASCGDHILKLNNIRMVVHVLSKDLDLAQGRNRDALPIIFEFYFLYCLEAETGVSQLLYRV